jgi:hypothetical protein
MLPKSAVTSRARRTSSDVTRNDVARNDVALGILQRITLTYALVDTGNVFICLQLCYGQQPLYSIYFIYTVSFI